VLRRAPKRALDPIRAVQDTGRQALAEMARLLGMLRRDSEELGLAPQPGSTISGRWSSRRGSPGFRSCLGSRGDRNTPSI
jgi:hypothetical protein